LTKNREPGVTSTFAELWGTPELLVSFDGVNLTPPFKNPDTGKWPHVDQAPKRAGMQCVQGILNFNPNGPEDGGLTVLRGSHNFVEEFFKTNKVTNIGSWGFEDFFGFDEEQAKWFAERGCETVKVCVGPGDLILWDSRTVHYNVPPQGDIVRAIVCMFLFKKNQHTEKCTTDLRPDVCMTPASFASEADLKKKKEIFEMWGRTVSSKRSGFEYLLIIYFLLKTHWPHANLWLDHKVPQRNGADDPLNRTEPLNKPTVTDQLLKLAGAVPY
jgi:hypothetical protein